MVKIIIADDQTLVRNGIGLLLNTIQDFNVVGEAINGGAVLDLLAKGVDADMVIIDLKMLVTEGYELIAAFKAARSDIKTVVLAETLDESYLFKSFDAGTTGYLLKSVSANEFTFALKHVVKEGRYLCSELSNMLLDKKIHNSMQSLQAVSDIVFTSRELEILDLIAKGCTNNEIADRLFISRRTVEGHRQNLIDKTKSRNTAELVGFSYRFGLLTA
jgi:DNA-binding NarL/FixJ family response regulator